MAEPFDPFDMPDVAGADPDAADGFDPLDMPEVAVDGPPANGEERPWYEDLALGAADGALLNNAGELGEYGEKLGNLYADVLGPSHEIDGMPAQRAGSPDADADYEALYELAKSSMPGKAGHALGLAGTGIAGSVVAGPTVAGQALAGGLTGAASSGGASGYNPGSMLAGGGSGALLGAAGGATGSASQLVKDWLGKSAGPVAGFIADKGAAALGLPSFALQPDVLRGAGGAAAALVPQYAAGLTASTGHAQDFNETELTKPDWTETTLRKPEPWQVAVGDAQMQSFKPEIGEAQLQTITPVIGEAVISEKAYAGKPAMDYSVKTVLSSGKSGLPPDAERELTSALLGGDEGKLDAVNFRLQQRHPGYAKRLQDQLTSLSEE